MSHDDDLDPGPVPPPDAEPTPAEKARARAFGELIDKVIAGRTPAAMPAEDRALVEVATVIRASVGRAELPAPRAAALVDQALRGAVDGPAPAGAPTPVVPLARARRTPWIVAGVASLVAAAAVVALLVRPAPRAAAPAAAALPRPTLPETWRSRPADPVVGVIPEARAGDAASRIDAIFADRLDGYRERTLARGGR